MFRLTNQLYIWWNSETPFSTFKELKFFRSPFQLYNENFFNWTMTYKTNADVVWKYGSRGELIHKLPMGKVAVNHVIAQKTGLVVSISIPGEYFCTYNMMNGFGFFIRMYLVVKLLIKACANPNI